MDLRVRRDWGTLALPPDTYGRSHLGIPLEVWRPSGACRVLVFAGIHGEEPETTCALSRALRQLSQPSPHCVVVLAANPDGLMRGTRGNARGVDLNRNFPTRSWLPDPVMHRSTLEDDRDVVLSAGTHAASEPEVAALLGLIDEMKPDVAVALHAPLACIDEETPTALGAWLAERTGLPRVSDVGYATPGSFGSWGQEHGLPVVTYEFPLASLDDHVRHQVPVLVDLLTRTDL